MPPSHEIQVLGVLVVVLVLAVGLGISVGHRKGEESFVEMAIVSSAGAAMLDSRCTVTSNTGNPHVMGVFSGLMRHPMVPDACYFRTVTGNGRIVATDECLPGSEIHEPAVTNDIKNESVLGARRCVVRLKPGLAPSAYAAYDNALHEKAVERTDRFNRVVADIVVKKGAMINMGADRNATTGSLVSTIQSRQNTHGNLMTNYGDLEALIRDATTKATTITGQASTAATTLASSRDWQSRAAVRSSEAASKRIELSSAQADAAPGRESQRTQERNNRKDTLASVNTNSALSINTGAVSAQADAVCAAKAAADKAVADKIAADKAAADKAAADKVVADKAAADKIVADTAAAAAAAASNPSDIRLRVHDTTIDGLGSWAFPGFAVSAGNSQFNLAMKTCQYFTVDSDTTRYTFSEYWSAVHFGKDVYRYGPSQLPHHILQSYTDHTFHFFYQQDSYRYLRSRHRGNFCMDVQGISRDSGAQVYMWDCWNGPNQRWKYDNKRRLVSENSGMCLDVWGVNAATGAEIKQYPCHDGANQRWTHDGGMLKPDHAPGQCADVWGGATGNGSGIYLYPCHGGPNQRFDWA
jgi:hypothetical protein